MSRIGRVFMFVAASVVSGLALAFIIVAWRPQLLRVAQPTPSLAAQPTRPASPMRRPLPRQSKNPVRPAPAEGDPPTDPVPRP